MIPGITASSRLPAVAQDVHRYWRIYITKTRDTGQFKAMVAEVEFRATLGGADQTGPGTAIGSTTFGGDFDYPAAYDNDSGTAWASESNAELPQWIGYDFGAGQPVAVAEVLLQASDTQARADRMPEDFSVEFSDDGVTWGPAGQVSAAPAWDPLEIRTYAIT